MKTMQKHVLIVMALFISATSVSAASAAGGEPTPLTVYALSMLSDHPAWPTLHGGIVERKMEITAEDIQSEKALRNRIFRYMNATDRPVKLQNMMLHAGRSPGVVLEGEKFKEWVASALAQRHAPGALTGRIAHIFQVFIEVKPSTSLGTGVSGDAGSSTEKDPL